MKQLTIHFGWLEGAFAALLLSYLAIGAFRGAGPLTATLGFATLMVGLFLSIRVSRTLVRQLLWRLRNRLIIAYFFIAVVPVCLIVALGVLGTYLLGGQLSTYLLTAELERRTGSLRNTTQFLVREPGRVQDWFNNIGPLIRSRYPGLEIIVQQGDRISTYPPQSRFTLPDATAASTSGLLVKDEMLYGWAYVKQGERRAMAAFPVTREFLGSLVPGVGESAILDLASSRSLLHDTLPDTAEPSHNQLPPAMSRFDYEIRWQSPLAVSNWNEPGRTSTEWLAVRTRASAILRTVSKDRPEMADQLEFSIFVVLAVLLLFAELIAFIIGTSITRTITGAVHELYEGTQRVAAGDFSSRIPLHGNDQLGELAVSFNQMTGNMKRLLAGEKERERLQAELEIASEVQTQLYPRTTPEMQCIHLCAVCKPARMVSGDYYDYQQLDKTKLAIAIGDVAGKGISAALLMATIQSAFRSQTRGAQQQNGGSNLSTSHIVTQLNRQLHADTAPEKFATFIMGVFDESTSILTYTNAGHLPPILVRDGQATRLDVNGMVVGAFASAIYDESRLELKRGDLLVFFTDGISEPENEYGEMFGEERLMDLAVKNAHLEDSAALACLMESVSQWTGEGELQDDMTMLLVRRC